MPIMALQPNVYLLVRLDGSDILRVDADGESYADGYDAADVFDALEAEGFAATVGPSSYTAGTGGGMVSGTTKAGALANLADAGQVLADGISGAGNIGVFVRLGGPANYLAAQSSAFGSHYEAE